MYGQCQFWNELTNKCELRKHLEAIGLKPIFPIEPPPEEHIKDYCKTKNAKNCWKREAVDQMVDDSIYDENYPVYRTVRQVLWRWIKIATVLSIIAFTAFIGGILIIFLTGGGLYFF